MAKRYSFALDNEKYYGVDDLLNTFTPIWENDLGKSVDDFVEAEFYIKFREETIYYVANPGNIAGSFSGLSEQEFEKKLSGKIKCFIQFDEKSYSFKDLVKIAKDVWMNDLGHEETELKDYVLYVNPLESTVHYTFNDNIKGTFGI